jgi:Putative adhesin
MTFRTPRHIGFALVASGVLALAITPSTFAASRKAVLKKSALKSVAVTTNQGSVRVTQCPPKGGKGICAKGVKVPGGQTNFFSDQGDVRIAVPKGVSVSVATTQGSVDVNNVSNVLAITTDQGSITATGIGSDSLYAETDQGDITLGFLVDPSRMEVKTNQGNINVTVAAGGQETDITASTIEGDITIAPKAPTRTFEARTSQGKIDLTLVGGPYKIEASTGQGTVTSPIVSAESARTVVAVAQQQGDVILRQG